MKFQNLKCFLLFLLYHNVIVAPVTIEEMRPSATQTVFYDDEDFELSCTASGSNINQVTWYKDDQVLDDKYFHFRPLESVEGVYEYGQTHAVRSVIRKKLKHFESESSSLSQNYL